jgi:hypothetical protein
MKRLTWFITGAATGAMGAGYAKRKVKRTASQLAPVNVARSTAAAVRRRGHDLVDAVKEGRHAMREREDELKARRDGRVRGLEDQIGPHEELLVDGQPVEPGRIVVMRRDE